MNVIYLYGAPALGKRTIAHELSKLTGFKVVDNHIHTNLVLNFFPLKSKGYWELRNKIRESIYELAIQENLKGLIITGVYQISDIDEVKKIIKFFKKHKVKIDFIQLKCSEKERKKRVVSQERKDKPLRSVTKLRPNKLFTKIDFFEHPTLDITYINAKDAASRILKILNLPA